MKGRIVYGSARALLHNWLVMLGIGTRAHGTERLHFPVQSSYRAYLQSDSGCPRWNDLLDRRSRVCPAVYPLLAHGVKGHPLALFPHSRILLPLMVLPRDQKEIVPL